MRLSRIDSLVKKAMGKWHLSLFFIFLLFAFCLLFLTSDFLLLTSSPAYAAGAKSFGAVSVVDDLSGASAASIGLAGGIYELTGGIGQLAAGETDDGVPTVVVESGFYSKLVSTPSFAEVQSDVPNAADVNWTDPSPSGTLYLIVLSTSIDPSVFVGSQSVYASPRNFAGLFPDTTYFAHISGSYMEGDDSVATVVSSMTMAVAPSSIYSADAGPWNARVRWPVFQNPAPSTFSSWTSQASDLPSARFGHAAAVSGNRVFISGGSDGTQISNKVWSAALSADGTVGTWIETVSLPEKRYGHAMTAAMGRLYVLGGYDGANLKSTVWSAPVSSTGLLGQWTDERSLGIQLYMHAAVFWDGRIFITGGYSASGVSAAVYKSSVSADGSLGTWGSEPVMPAPRYAHAMTVSNGWLYVAGGHDGASVKSSVWKTTITAAGSLTGWETDAPSLPSQRYGHAIFAINNALFLSGGSNGMSPQSLVWRSSVSSDGSIDSWTMASSLPSARQFYTVFEAGGTVYAAGGSDGFSAKTQVWSARAEGTGYCAERATNAGFSTDFSSSSWTAGGQYDFGDLTPNTTYYFRVKARNRLGAETGYSADISTITLAAIPSTAAWSAVGVSSVQANWGPDMNPAGTGYTMQISSYADFNPLADSSDTVNAYALFTGLDPNTTYYG
ncbi:MAG: kelch repeat-containing protein, partial [bacterium]